MLEAIELLVNVSGRALQTRRVEIAKGDMARTNADISRIGAALAWQPRTPLRDGLASMWSWTAARVAAG
jgi:nucleoside-diphosphate-sugar epimerase